MVMKIRFKLPPIATMILLLPLTGGAHTVEKTDSQTNSKKG